MMDSNEAHDEYTGEETKIENGDLGCTNYSLIDSNEAHDEYTGEETKIENGHSSTNYSVDSDEALDKFTGEETGVENATDRCNLDQKEGEGGSWKGEVMV